MLNDQETGEVIGSKFAKMFFDDLSKLFSLSSAQKNLLFVMMRDCSYDNTVNMKPDRKKKYVAELGFASQKSLNNSLKTLEVANVVQRDSEYPTKYTVNPEVMFKGNDYQRAKIIISYTGGERLVEVVTRKESDDKSCRDDR